MPYYILWLSCDSCRNTPICCSVERVPVLPWIALALGALALAVSWRVAVLSAASAPNALLSVVTELGVQVRELAANSEGRDGKMLAWRAEMEGIFEAVEGALDSVEKKRRQAAASASRADRANGGVQSPTDPIQLAQMARDRGLL